MDNGFEPLMHVTTNNIGEYVLDNIPIASLYTVFAISAGKKLKQGKQFSLSDTEKKRIDFTLEEDPAMKLGIIAGGPL